MNNGLTITLYIIGWVLLLLFIVGVTLIAYYARRIDLCRVSSTIYCLANPNGTSQWQCTNTSTPDNPTTFLSDVVSGIQNQNSLIGCPSNEDVPASGTTPTIFASYVMQPNVDTAASCDLSQSSLPFGCTTPLQALINFPGDPLVVPSNNIVLPSTVFNWFCDPSRPPNQSTDAKTIAWNNFIQNSPDFQLSQPITFLGQSQP